jgi:hypothetical protein
MIMLKVWHKAITKFALVVPNNAGASAIFKLFKARPQLLEKRIKRPVDATAGSRKRDSSSITAGNDDKPGGGTTINS